MTESTLMRIHKDTVEDIKLLKRVGNFRGSQQDVISMLVRRELKKTMVETEGGYVGVGAVVQGPGKKVSVIAAVDEDRITFRDGSTLVNGGTVSYGLIMLAECVDRYEGGVVDA